MATLEPMLKLETEKWYPLTRLDLAKQQSFIFLLKKENTKKIIIKIISSPKLKT